MTFELPTKVDITKLISWVYEAQEAHRDWRAESWEDNEMADGLQWTQADYDKAMAKRIKPLTINRTFPIINYVHGYFLNNKMDILAKGRTKHDTDLGQVMSSSIKFVADQNRAQHKLSRAFKQQIVNGFGCLSVGFNPDPREERIAIRSHNWYSVWWDKYATPWMEKNDCRYVFTQDWTDLDDLKALFPDSKTELSAVYDDLTRSGTGTLYDQHIQDLIMDRVEDQKDYASFWADASRHRVKPVEMWYTELVDTAFAIMPSGYAIELSDNLSAEQELQAVTQATEIVRATVKKMRVTTFLDNLVLQDQMSPYAHDQYPFVPFVSYLDRFDFPFGVPRQIKEQDREVNSRRSMGLALMSSRRVLVEQGATENDDRTYAEANRLDGYIKLKTNGLKKIRIEDLSPLARGQEQYAEQSEQEIAEIAGAVGDSLKSQPQSRSGKALVTQKETTSVMIASLIDNARYSNYILGTLISSLIKDTWTGPRVMRVTDSFTQTEKFININEKIESETGIEVRNDITQATFDLVVSDAPLTDTIREKNMDLLFAAVNAAGPENVDTILNLAFELSDIPNKDALLAPLRQRTGYDPDDDMLSTEEREEKARLKTQERAEEAQRAQQVQAVNTKLEQEDMQADIELKRAQAASQLASAGAKKQEADQKGFQIGVQATQMTRNNVKEEEDPDFKTRSEQAHPKT